MLNKTKLFILLGLLSTGCAEMTPIEKTQWQYRNQLVINQQNASTMTVAKLRQAILAGVNIRATDIDGNTPLLWASMFNTKPQVIKYLLENSVRLYHRNRQGEDVILTSSLNPNTEIMKIFLAYDMDINVHDNYGRNALIRAVYGNYNYEMLLFLIKHGIKVNDTDKQGRSAIIYAALHRPDLHVFNILIDNHADINIQDHNGMNAFMYLVRQNADIYLLQYLLDHGAKTDCFNNHGDNALLIALKRPDYPSKVHLIKFLLTHGGVIDQKVFDYVNHSHLPKPIKDLFRPYNPYY